MRQCPHCGKTLTLCPDCKAELHPEEIDEDPEFGVWVCSKCGGEI